LKRLLATRLVFEEVQEAKKGDLQGLSIAKRRNRRYKEGMGFLRLNSISFFPPSVQNE